MEEIIALAQKLGEMGILCASLEMDFQRLKHTKLEVKNYLDFSASTTSAKMIYENTDNSEKPLGFTVQILGVKMYFNCPKVKMEVSQQG